MFAVIHLPDFALQAALRHEPDWRGRPIALVDPALAKPLVVQLTDVARAAGVTAELTPVQALARCREVSVRHRSPVQEAAATEALLQVAYGFSPNLENTTPGTVTLDLRGLSELTDASDATSQADAAGNAPGPNARLVAWAGRLQSAVAALNLIARIGVGPTPNVARLAARWAGTPQSNEGSQAGATVGPPAEAASNRPRAGSHAVALVVAPVIVGNAPDFIAALPVEALEPSVHVADILRRWGIRTVGELLALGQGEVTERLGLEAFALFAAASTRDQRPLHLVRPAERFEESFEFEAPVETMEPLLFLLRRFVDQLGPRLEVFGLAAGLLALRLRLESAAVIERRLRVPQPTRSADVLFRMLQTHLEMLRTDAPIVGVALAIEPVRPEQRQFSLFEAAIRDPHQFQETLARLSALVGAERVGTPVRENSRRPDAFKLLPPDFENAPRPPAHVVPELLRPTPLRRLRPGVEAAVECAAPCGDAAPTNGIAEQANEPGRLLDCPTLSGTPSPEASAARPLSLQCSVARGTLRVVLGPWNRSGEWWEPGSWQRTEWDVETASGQALRLVQREGRWLVEGVLD